MIYLSNSTAIKVFPDPVKLSAWRGYSLLRGGSTRIKDGYNILFFGLLKKLHLIFSWIRDDFT